MYLNYLKEEEEEGGKDGISLRRCEMCKVSAHKLGPTAVSQSSRWYLCSPGRGRTLDHPQGQRAWSNSEKEREGKRGRGGGSHGKRGIGWDRCSSRALIGAQRSRTILPKAATSGGRRRRRRKKGSPLIYKSAVGSRIRSLAGFQGHGESSPHRGDRDAPVTREGEFQQGIFSVRD